MVSVQHLLDVSSKPMGFDRTGFCLSVGLQLPSEKVGLGRVWTQIPSEVLGALWNASSGPVCSCTLR